MKRESDTPSGDVQANVCRVVAPMSASKLPLSSSPQVAVIGGGPAGLRAAEVIAASGLTVTVFEGKPSVGRKFLVAGRGGLNLTHSEPVERFAGRYTDGDSPHGNPSRWTGLLTEFSPGDLREWAAGLGVETYVGTSGRVFPRGQQAATLLRRWVGRLKEAGVRFQVNHRWQHLEQGEGGKWRLGFEVRAAGEEESGPVLVEAAAVVFALGGASWPQTGSDGKWTEALEEQLGVRIAPWQGANCGWEVPWNPGFLAAAEGLPLKNLAITVADQTISGEALVTRYGLEGGTLYTLGPALRRAPAPRRLFLDLKPTLNAAQLTAKLPVSTSGTKKVSRALGLDELASRWRLGVAARALLEFHGPGQQASQEAWITAVKGLPLPLGGPRPVAEAISTAGGLSWEEIQEQTLGLRRGPGLFVAGEMLDWEAPTGGYLLQGCFATGTRAGRAVTRFLRSR